MHAKDAPQAEAGERDAPEPAAVPELGVGARGGPVKVKPALDGVQEATESLLHRFYVRVG